MCEYVCECVYVSVCECAYVCVVYLKLELLAVLFGAKRCSGS